MANQKQFFDLHNEPLAAPPSASSSPRELKEQGIARAVEGKEKLLDDARQIAKIIAIDGDGTCNADQVANALKLRKMEPLGRAAGALFRGADWEFTGNYIESEQTQNHGHPIKVWRYTGKAKR